jgi:hypothetical protein
MILYAAREVYWQFLKPPSGNSKITMVGMRLSFPFARALRTLFLICRGAAQVGGRVDE